MTHVRPSTGESLNYRLAISLHVRFSLDAEMRDVNLLHLSRSQTKEHLLAIERTTGLSTGALAHDAELED